MQDTSLEKPSIKLNSQAHLIVIGGTSGIGLALALHHISLGWQVSVVGHSLSKIVQINEEHPDIITYSCDLTDEQQRQRLFKELDTARAIGKVDRVIYSAGSYLNERIHTLNQEDSDTMLAINLQAFHEVFYWASTAFKQQLKQQLQRQAHNDASLDANLPKPSLITIASIAGTMDYPYASLYAKSKRAMIATASAYRVALAPFNIQVTCIAPGYIDTQTLRDLNHGDASHKPFIISLDKAVTLIMQSIDDDVELAVFPRSMRYITTALDKLPKPILNRLLRNKLDKKISKLKGNLHF